jgi:hypothetical protein
MYAPKHKRWSLLVITKFNGRNARKTPGKIKERNGSSFMSNMHATCTLTSRLEIDGRSPKIGACTQGAVTAAGRKKNKKKKKKNGWRLRVADQRPWVSIDF